ncbi:MAG: type I-E CRISPR-associated protein Cse1/CasA [Dehalococcoidia bacterium]|nr:type I-E CRISPR-associated protein Cse1/CasA [Dehalococcoidia bacterium]
MQTMHDLLAEPVFGVLLDHGPDRLSLPGILAALSGGRLRGFRGLRPHQADPWHVFLVQLAASVHARFPRDPPLPDDPPYWQEGLLALADGLAEAWALGVEDVTKPAFFQHPWESLGEEEDYGLRRVRGKTLLEPRAMTPDQLDVLITTKNHDLKASRIAPSEAEAWAYALVALQTTSGYLGKGNYGIVRMNGGFGSRPIVSWCRSLDPSARFREETEVLIRIRASIRQSHGYAERGVVLTWLRPWNREDHQFPLSALEPWFIECARPVRLWRTAEGRIVALTANSKRRQIDAYGIDTGDVGDPWTPIWIAAKGNGRLALTVEESGFTPELLTALLFEQGYELTALQKPRPAAAQSTPSEAPEWFVASCLVRGKGVTHGYHRVELPVPAVVRRALLDDHRRKRLGELAQGMLGDASKVGSSLSIALALLIEGGPEEADAARVESWLRAVRERFAEGWRATYFPILWQGAAQDHHAVRERWRQELVGLGERLLAEAAAMLPLPSGRRWRARTRAEGLWWGSLRKAGLLPDTEEAMTHPSS